MSLLSELESAPAGGCTYLLCTTNPGLEDIVAKEFSELALAAALPQPVVELRPFGFGGHTLVRAQFREGGDGWQVAARMRSVHHVVRLLYSLQLQPDSAVLTAVGHAIRERGVDAGIERAQTFRITSRRSGNHDFSRLDIQREAGAAVAERYGTAVDLEEFDLNVRVDVHGRTCVVGTQLTREPLSNRFDRLYRPQATLRPNVAFALLRLTLASKRTDDGILLDPCCGSGTVLFETAKRSPEQRIFGSDLDRRAVAGTHRNLSAAGIGDRVHLACADALELGSTWAGGRIEAIVTNPPYGVRLSRNLHFYDFYSRFLAQCGQLLEPGARLGFIAWKRGLVDRANQRLKQFSRIHVRVVEMGGIYPRIYVMKRR